MSVSSGSRFCAADPKATKRPSGVIFPPKLGAYRAGSPCVLTLIRSVSLVSRSCTKTSSAPSRFVGTPSFSTRFGASELNTTKRPFGDIEVGRLVPVPCSPVELTLTRSVVPLSRSYTKVSTSLLVSPGTSFAAFEENATNRPSPLITGSPLERFTCDPSGATLTRVVRVLADPAAARCPEARPDKAKKLVIRTIKASKPLLFVPLIGVTLVFISIPSVARLVSPSADDGRGGDLEAA